MQLLTKRPTSVNRAILNRTQGITRSALSVWKEKCVSSKVEEDYIMNLWVLLWHQQPNPCKIKLWVHYQHHQHHHRRRRPASSEWWFQKAKSNLLICIRNCVVDCWVQRGLKIRHLFARVQCPIEAERLGILTREYTNYRCWLTSSKIAKITKILVKHKQMDIARKR